MKHFYLKQPVVTEKSMNLAQTKNWYTFWVESLATKEDIAEVVEKTYGVNVIAVNTVMIPGKVKRTGKKRLSVQGSKKKKAIVQLKAGQTIAAFDIQDTK